MYQPGVCCGVAIESLGSLERGFHGATHDILSDFQVSEARLPVRHGVSGGQGFVGAHARILMALFKNQTIFLARHPFPRI
jgi:hypothetical protein